MRMELMFEFDRKERENEKKTKNIAGTDWSLLG